MTNLDSTVIYEVFVAMLPLSDVITKDVPEVLTHMNQAAQKEFVGAVFCYLSDSYERLLLACVVLNTIFGDDLLMHLAVAWAGCMFSNAQLKNTDQLATAGSSPIFARGFTQLRSPSKQAPGTSRST